MICFRLPGNTGITSGHMPGSMLNIIIRKSPPVFWKPMVLLLKPWSGLYREEYRALFEVGFERGGWDQKMTGGPFWIDKSRLLENPLRGYHQIVGHTPVETVEHYNPYEDDEDTSVTFCDCIERGDGSFYTLEIL